MLLLLLLLLSRTFVRKPAHQRALAPRLLPVQQRQRHRSSPVARKGNEGSRVVAIAVCHLYGNDVAGTQGLEHRFRCMAGGRVRHVAHPQHERI